MILAMATPTFATSVPEAPFSTQERIRTEKLFEDIEPVDVVTTYTDGRITTVTTYILDNGDVFIDTFERGANIARTYEGSDTVTRSVKGPGGTITLKAGFRWWTSSGNPGDLGSWQSVECTSKSATYSVNSGYGIRDKVIEASEGAISWGTAWARAGAYIYPSQHGGQFGVDYSVKIICDDMGKISDATWPIS